MKTRFSQTAMFYSLMLASPVLASVRHLERDDVTGHVGSTREELLATREMRKEDFSRKLEELKQQWADHESGKRRLSEGFETQRLLKKIKAYEKKVEHLNQQMDDRVSRVIMDVGTVERLNSASDFFHSCLISPFCSLFNVYLTEKKC
jgi:hypothetical protein